ncbi:hypothetical protein BC941DRAFT_412798 [Chlamydoabsidia padenii]|nr:hypothetical protein BC941DRAFT_412798 [Chlamydoabsidia padenii]
MDNDGFKSFPSGHASYSFSGWVYLSLFFAKHIHLFNQKEGVRTIKSIVFWTPLVGAVFMCATRFVENRHHFTDLLIGGIIGATCGVFGYLQYHSSLFEYDKQNSHRLSRSSDLFQQDEESQNVHRHRDDPERTLSPGPSRSSEV